MVEEVKKKGGRTKMFEKGLEPIHHLCALLLAMGKGPYDVAKRIGYTYEGIAKWRLYDIFEDLVEEYKKMFLEKVIADGFDGMEFLKRTQIESLKSTAHRSDGLRARELEAKITGELSPEKQEAKYKEQIKEKSDKELAKLLESPVLDDTNTEKTNRAGTGEEKA